MLIISNALTNKTDEGCLKVANTLISRIKKKEPETVIVSFDDKPSILTVHMKLNKFFLNSEFLKMVKNEKGPVIYFPFSSNSFASVLRTFILSFFVKGNLKLMCVLRHDMNQLSTFLLKKSRAEVYTFSKESYCFFNDEIKIAAKYLKTGVDTQLFIPVNDDISKQKIRRKYNIPIDKKVVLHVGHLTKERNIEQLLKINDEYHIVIVASYVSDDINEAKKIKQKLEEKNNITIIDSYIENIQEIYQMSDVYFFPTLNSEGCIDNPLSVMEAASCNLPIITTYYGELKELKGKDSFWFIDSFEEDKLNQLIKSVLEQKKINSREAVLSYDWNNTVSFLLNQ